MLRQTWLLLASFIALLAASQLVNAASIDVNNYNIYIGDINNDGFSDYYFEHKNKPYIVLLHSRIATPIIVRPTNPTPNFVIKSLGKGLGYSEAIAFNIDVFSQQTLLKSLRLATVNNDYFAWNTGYQSKQVVLLRGATPQDRSVLIQFITAQQTAPALPKIVHNNETDDWAFAFSNKSIPFSLDFQLGGQLLKFTIQGNWVKLALNNDPVIASSSAQASSAPPVVRVLPTLVTPTNGAIVDLSTSQNPCFNWTRGSSTGPDWAVWHSYHVVLQTKPTYSQSSAIAIYDESNNATISTCWNGGTNWRTLSGDIATSLTQNTTYYWFLVTSYGNGWGPNNTVSGPNSFTLKPKPVTDSDAAIRLLWGDVANAIKNNNRSALTDRFDSSVLNKYNQIFDALGAQLSDVGNQLGEIAPLFVTETTAIYLVTKKGDDGSNYVHTIKFVKNSNGDWKVSEL